MPPTITRPMPHQAPTRQGRAVAGWVAAGVAALAVAVGAGPVLDPPATVDFVVVNPSAAAVTVVVSDGSPPELPIATIDPGEERPVQEVLDQGETWTVTYRIAGEVVGEETVARADLERQGFRLRVPEGVDG